MTTWTNDLIDADRGQLNPQIYSDAEIYQRELEQVFSRSWLFLAHDSQLPRRGSFIQTYMGEDPVLVVRQGDGSVKAFLNQCRHRGMRICRSDEGTSKAFTCTYHGWSYDLEGNLASVPLEERAYRGGLDKSKWGALKVPRIANYKGFYFGTWSADTPEFTDYLGEMAYYFDAMVDRWEGGIEFIPGTSKWVIDANWKLAAEQIASDMYHVPNTHAAGMMALTDDPVGWGKFTNLPPDVPGRQFAGNGHGSGSFWIPTFDETDLFAGQEYTDWILANLESTYQRIGPDRAHKVAGHNAIFPNFGWLHNVGAANTIRVYHPRGPEQIELWAWTYVPKNAPDAVKAAIRRGVQRSFSPSGSFETDDGENWTEIQTVLRGYQARRNRLNVQMGLGHEELDSHGLPGRSNDVFSESAARGFYQRWNDLMSGMSWEDIIRTDATRQALVPAAQEVPEA